ncbi:MAG: anti-sigma factor [Thermoleophilia bacterium]
MIGSRHDTTTPPVPVGRVTLLPLASGSTAHGTATMLADHELEIDATGLAPSPANTVYTVWLLNRNLTMEPVGSFQVGTDGRTHILMPMPFNAQRYDFLDISVEPDNGVPTHSGKSVLRATIT